MDENIYISLAKNNKKHWCYKSRRKIPYFNFFLFFPICFFIILFKMLKIQFVYSVLKTPNVFLNLILYKIFSSEKFFLNKFNFPLGVSLILIGEKEK